MMDVSRQDPSRTFHLDTFSCTFQPYRSGDNWYSLERFTSKVDAVLSALHDTQVLALFTPIGASQFNGVLRLCDGDSPHHSP